MNGLKWDRDFALEQAADDAELLSELLEIFKDSMGSDLRILEQGLVEGSAEKVVGAAHSIKGAAASLGILGINEIALIVEKDSREGSLEVARENLATMQTLLEELKKL